jgi:hypothetical protein
MSTYVERFSSFVGVLEDALNIIDDNVSAVSHDTDIVTVLDTIMEVNVMLVYRFHCGPIPKKDLDDIRKKVTDVLERTKRKTRPEQCFSCPYIM